MLVKKTVLSLILLSALLPGSLAGGTIATQINPQAAISQDCGPPGTAFVLQWSGFTPNNTLTSHLRKPDGMEFQPLQFNTDREGNARHVIDSSMFTRGTYPPGYQAWAVDDATRRQSNILSFEVTRTIEGFTATTIGQSVSFFHNGTDPTPSFIFCGRAGDVISFRLVGTIETGFVLTNEAGGVLASGSTFGSFLRFDGPLLTSGNFKILAFRNNCCSSVGTYGFNLQRVSNPNFAVAIACGGRGAGLVSTIGDRRTFTFDGAAGDKITITMSRGSSGNVQPLIEVYDANGNLIADAAATSGGTTATISNLTLSRSGRFSILASDTATQVGSYTLSLQCQR